MPDTTNPPSPTPARRSAGLSAWVGLAASVSLCLVVAKVILVTERHGAEALLVPSDLGLYFFRDGVVALVWTALVVVSLAVSRGSRKVVAVLWGAACLAAVYVGLNIAFFRSFSSPLNRSLLDMAEGMADLSDSASSFLTLQNVWPLVMCLATVVMSLALLSRAGRRTLTVFASVQVLALVAVSALALGMPSDRKPLGLDRNALWEAALLPFPRTLAMEEIERIDISAPLPRGLIHDPDAPMDDLSDLAAIAPGMNVVLVVLESTSARYLGAYGAEDDPMPRVSALTEQALVFDNWYAPVPTSMKCMFSYFCSTYPYPDAAAESVLAPRLPCHSWPEVMKEQGYRTELVTSARFVFNRKTQFLDDRGFDVMHDADSLADRPSSEALFRNNWGLQEDAALAEMQSFLDTPSDEPFFLTYVPIFPHHPYELPPETPNRFGDDDFGRYRAALGHTDRIVGELYDGLKAAGRLDDTLFVVIADHGEPFGQHMGNTMHGNAIYEENLHVPAMVHNPVLFPESRHVAQPADHTALAPTLLGMLGIDAPDRWQGISLLDGQPDMVRFVVDSSFLLLGLRDGPYKYIRDLANEHDELYDLRDDPLEQRNVAAEHPELVQQYLDHLTYHYHHQIGLFEDYEGFLTGQLAQDEVVHLENLAPVFTDMGWGKLRPDLSSGMLPLNVGGKDYTDGLGTHAPGSVSYELRGRYDWFDGAVGRDVHAMQGQCRAEIWVDGVRVWKSSVMTRAMSAQDFHIPVTGAQELELVLLDGGDSGRGDHIDWVDVILY